MQCAVCSRHFRTNLNLAIFSITGFEFKLTTKKGKGRNKQTKVFQVSESSKDHIDNLIKRSKTSLHLNSTFP